MECVKPARFLSFLNEYECMTRPSNFSLHAKHAKSLGSVIRHSATGRIPSVSSSSAPQETRDFTMSNSSLGTNLVQNLNKTIINSALSIAESLPTGRRRISKDKSSSCNPDSLTTNLSLISGPDSTGNALALGSFYTMFSEAMSKKLWLPTETDSAGLPLNCCIGSFNSIRSNSWFSMRQFQAKTPSWPQMFCPFSKSMLVESTAKDLIKTKTNSSIVSKKPKGKTQATTVTRSLKIRIYPHHEDKNTIRSWFGGARYTYNLGLDGVEKLGMKINEYSLRNRWVTAKNLHKDPEFQSEWLLKVPKHIREGAIHDLVQAYKTNFEKKKLNPNHTFQVKYRVKKDRESSIVLDRQCLSYTKNGAKLRIYPKMLKHDIAWESNDPGVKHMPKKFDKTCRLSMSRSGKLFIHILFEKSVQAPENQGSLKHEPRICAVDPGVSPFMAIWSPTAGKAFQIGVKDKFKLEKWVSRLDGMLYQAKRTSVKSLRYRRMKAYYRGREKLENRLRHMHVLTARFLTQNFDIILYPHFHVKSMVRNGPKRKIRQRTVKDLYHWNFHKFKMILAQKAEEMSKRLIFVSERDTSRTCTNCFVINPKLGGSKVFRCVNPQCLITYDRDVSGGARNIFLKNHTLI